ncbi:MAG: hybrid sensor histidine kinase/response regulator [Alphaproteobacteria bacterium]|nr:hybrid sensor histidine kinase/response regulator [Alphaproteobacteria bacterium]
MNDVETKAPQARKHLVVVDDEPVILQILTAVFDDGPWRVSTCSTGNEALRLMRTEGVDILLTDKNLPDVNGLELLRFAKEVNDLAEVIIITGYASLETALTALELQAFDYVLKPLNNVFDIRKKVERASERQDITAENRRLVHDLQRKNHDLEAALAETRKLQAELIQSEKLAGIGTLAAGIAHEVSSPLFGIMGLAEAIAEEDDVKLCQDYAREIVEYSRTIRDIVVELSSYSRASTSEYLTTVELTRVIEDAVRLVERSADCQGVDFEITVEPQTYLNARTSEIQQVFVNLVKNAVEAVRTHRPDGDGRIRVEAGSDDDRVWARVIDNGPGIPADNIGLVFDPFYTTKAPGKGTGLGLNIVYRIATKYRGTVSVESVEGQGTVFTLSFPKGGSAA